ncbi:hypothetical protein HUW46_09164 [Amycolatopsis sp. CA-230715]|nr:hypothetical protein HUW46_09164 [Amycolatopsis sp. CA-230715]
MTRLLQENTASGERRILQVFQDFCELSALTLRNAVDQNGFDAREARYLAIAANYRSQEMRRFAEALAHLKMALRAKFSDVLGHLYMTLDLGNERLGQFFTPYDVSILTVRIMAGDLPDRLRDQEFVAVVEPTCGSGGMVIAKAELIREHGFDYRNAMHVLANDIDLMAVHMTYVQLALLDIPAVVVHGDVLTLEERDRWATPAHINDGWDQRLTTESLPCTSLGPDEVDSSSLRSPGGATRTQ